MGVFKLVVITSLLMMGVQGELGTSFIFNSFKYPTPNLTYQGDAHVPHECKFVRLTQTNGSGVPGDWSTGRVLYSKPVLMWDTSDFHTTIKFTILPSKHDAADGIAFFMAPVGNTIPEGITSGGGNLAIYGPSGANPSVFAVEFDTFSNEWDPNYRHVGINMYSRISYNTSKFDSATGEAVTAHIKYEARSSTVTVVATTCTQTAKLSYGVNLSNIMSQRVQVGIASSTGSPSEYIGVHDIHYWSFTSNIAKLATPEYDIYTRPSVLSV